VVVSGPVHTVEVSGPLLLRLIVCLHRLDTVRFAFSLPGCFCRHLQKKPCVQQKQDVDLERKPWFQTPVFQFKNVTVPDGLHKRFDIDIVRGWFAPRNPCLSGSDRAHFRAEFSTRPDNEQPASKPSRRQNGHEHCPLFVSSPTSETKGTLLMPSLDLPNQF